MGTRSPEVGLTARVRRGTSSGVTRADRIRETLTRAFAPTKLDVVDDSARHAGHAGASAAGETHYNVLIEAPGFGGKGRVERHRMVNTALELEFARGLHALALVARAPGE
jgi:BolA family transcriptional regulator, general stress-responsive regulator